MPMSEERARQIEEAIAAIGESHWYNRNLY
jgi:hypothetical protein